MYSLSFTGSFKQYRIKNMVATGNRTQDRLYSAHSRWRPNIFNPVLFEKPVKERERIHLMSKRRLRKKL